MRERDREIVEERDRKCVRERDKGQKQREIEI